jgi:hypothetical protein
MNYTFAEAKTVYAGTNYTVPDNYVFASRGDYETVSD